MGIKLEWLNHPQTHGDKKGGIARFKVGETYHHVHVASATMATQLHKLLQHAHDAGVKKGDDLSTAYERQRVADLLIG